MNIEKTALTDSFALASRILPFGSRIGLDYGEDCITFQQQIISSDRDLVCQSFSCPSRLSNKLRVLSQTKDAFGHDSRPCIGVYILNQFDYKINRLGANIGRIGFNSLDLFARRCDDFLYYVEDSDEINKTTIDDN